MNSAAHFESFSENAVRITTCVLGSCALISTVASIPSTSGMRMSMSTTSGCRRATSSPASAPLRAVPTTSNPKAGRLSRSTNVVRSSSSAIRRRIGSSGLILLCSTPGDRTFRPRPKCRSVDAADGVLTHGGRAALSRGGCGRATRRVRRHRRSGSSQR